MEPVAVSELAEVAHCERKVYLRALHGERVHTERRRRRALGVRVHRAAETDRATAAAGDGGDRRCFVASAVFGADAPETLALRRFRDAVLLPRRSGRALVRGYYATGPAMVALLRRVPPAARLARAALRWFLHRRHARGFVDDVGAPGACAETDTVADDDTADAVPAAADRAVPDAAGSAVPASAGRAVPGRAGRAVRPAAGPDAPTPAAPGAP